MWTQLWLDLMEGIGRGLVMAIAILAVLCPNQLEPAKPFLSGVSAQQGQEEVGADLLSRDARQVRQWIRDTHDNQQSAFLVIDKRAARLYVFDEDARLRGSTSVLLGAARGDDTVPGIGQRPVAEVRPEERTTPAGRFLAERGHDSRGEDVVWVDYDAGVSIHRVLTTNPAEHRLARLASPDIADKRISYGCINVPVAFYEAQIRPVFERQRALVYVLPERKPIQQVFAMASSAAR
ncbi:hypothetical protein [Aquabacterium sp.]|uniref:hypothetical protein n=1 Tax=Aquabacterium sp. TaxID=1872578 RepID=UPI0025C4506D|nr:hypothetical protein [Aquabacterium sp.]